MLRRSGRGCKVARPPALPVAERRLAIRRVMRAARAIAAGRKSSAAKLLPADFVSLLEGALAEVKASFPRKRASWYVRAVARSLAVRSEGANRWTVYGLPELGDTYSYYTVVYSPYANKYVCSCMSHSFGRYRQAKVCTHVAAVILYRRLRASLLAYLGGGGER